MNGDILRGKNHSYLYFPNDTETVLSNGKFSTVFLGANTTNSKKVIIKRLNRRLEESKLARLRFMLEASINIDHPGVIKTLDYLFEDNAMYIIQEFVRGMDLKAIIRANLLTGNHKLVSVFSANILEILQAIHDNGIIHCDLKPSNIIVAYKPDSEDSFNWDNPEIKIIDFGLAHTKENIPFFSATNRSPFSILYSAPEIVLNHTSLIDQRTDLYSFGLIMMEMFTGEPAYYADHPAKLLGLQINGKLRQPKKMYNHFFDIISKAANKSLLPASPKNMPKEILSKHLIEGKEMRYSSANEIIHAISEFMQNPGEKPSTGFKQIKYLFRKQK
jgi:serine/threonine protein kinase